MRGTEEGLECIYLRLGSADSRREIMDSLLESITARRPEMHRVYEGGDPPHPDDIATPCDIAGCVVFPPYWSGNEALNEMVGFLVSSRTFLHAIGI